MSKRVCCVFGTRPEAIKMAPVVLALQAEPNIDLDVCVTGQHREMLRQVLDLFSIRPDCDLAVMRPGQSLTELSARVLTEVGRWFDESQPDLVLLQGDTTTVLCAALAAFYRRIPVGHVEAGLRTRNLYSPWPEEANRRMTSAITTLHFAPTTVARDNLVAECVAPDRIFVTGNPVIDALHIVRERLRTSSVMIPGLPQRLQPGNPDGMRSRIVLVTGHRRENFGAGFEAICSAIAELAGRRPEIDFVYPVHLNPRVREPVLSILGRSSRAGGGSADDGGNIHLLEPLNYLEFVALMERSYLILTDSGGIQEEAPGLGRPVLVMRDTTERPEALAAGAVRLVGTSFESIIGNVEALLDDPALYRSMSESPSPYGDGTAGKEIARIVCRFLRCRSCAG